MHPDHGQVAGRGHYRGDGAGVALRHVHAHVGQLVLGQEVQGLPLVLLAHPGVVAELHAHPARRGPLRAGQDVLLVSPRDREPGRVLEQERAELARAAQRLERGQEPLPGLVGHLRVDVLEVDPLLAGLGRGLAQVGGQCLDRRRVLGEQPERLDVEGEPGRGAFGPGFGGLLGGQRVVGGVHLDQRELARVVPEPFLRRVRLRRVPACLDQRPVGPRRRAHANMSHISRLRSIPGERGPGEQGPG